MSPYASRPTLARYPRLFAAGCLRHVPAGPLARCWSGSAWSCSSTSTTTPRRTPPWKPSAPSATLRSCATSAGGPGGLCTCVRTCVLACLCTCAPVGACVYVSACGAPKSSPDIFLGGSGPPSPHPGPKKPLVFIDVCMCACLCV